MSDDSMPAAGRGDGRAPGALRPITLERGVGLYAEGSCLITAGRTRVLCTASVEKGVPGWRKGQGQGWVTAEYSMLPRATSTRNRRERGQVGGRTQEIQRLIGRSLRGCVDAVTLFDEDTPRDLIAALVPDVLVKGGDYTVETVAGADEVIAAGGRVEIIPLVPGRSTTSILQRAKRGGEDG